MDTVSVAEAVKRIHRYLKDSTSFPYFVVVDGKSEYDSILNECLSLKKVRVSDYCNGDAFVAYDPLCEDLSGREEPCVLVGLGDSVALDGYHKILGRIQGIATPKKLVVLCRGVRVPVMQLQEADHKFNYLRVCEVESELDYFVVKVNPSVCLEAVEDFQKLLRALEDGASGEIYVHTELLIKASRMISNAYEAVREKKSHFTMPVSLLPSECWEEYSRDDELDGYDLFHWRSYLQLKMNPPQDGYLKMALDSSPAFEDFKNRFYEALLDIPHTRKDYWSLYAERKELLADRPEIEVSLYVAMSRQAGENRIYYLTDNTTTERCAVIEELTRLGSVPNQLDRIYPALRKYLSDYAFECKNGELFTEYFSDYKRQKLTNDLTELFDQKVRELARDGNRKYTPLPKRGFLVESLDNGSNELYWIDALGVEYLGYIQALAKDMGLHIHIRIGRAELPTLTSCNRNFYDEWKGGKTQTRELDELKHGGLQGIRNDQKSPIHLAKELIVVDKALAWAKNELLQGQTEKVVVASDHGASRLAVISGRENKWRMETDGIHSGRCCPVSEIDEKPETATENGGFWVLANYDRFKGGRKACIEVHGGASLEEVLVPVIEISLSNETIKIKNMTEIAYYNLVTKEEPSITIFSPKHIENLKVRFNGTTYSALEEDDGHYKVVLRGVRRAVEQCAADVLEGDNLIGEVTFSIQSRGAKMKSAEEDVFFQ
ncbi:MAG: BREX-4 system phosphatase PglZ [Lachnospiraceae bacterium]|nr:BREX-4 system phosphatase PglZ [Lachnospiraceae bacterium]